MESNTEEDEKMLILEPYDDDKLSIIVGKTKILLLLDTFDIKKLYSSSLVLKRIIKYSNSNSENVQKDLILIIEIIRKLQKGVKEREINEMSQTPNILH